MAARKPGSPACICVIGYCCDDGRRRRLEDGPGNGQSGDVATAADGTALRVVKLEKFWRDCLVFLRYLSF